MDFGDLVNQFEQLEEKPREEYKRSAFGWPGSKYKSLSKILPKLRPSNKYVETCGGSGVVLLNRQPSGLEVFNDRNSGVTAFFRCIQNYEKNRQLVDRLKFMVHSREEFIWCSDTWENPTDDVERAARWYYMVRTSFGQLGRNWARATNCAAMIGPKFHRGLKIFPFLYERLKNVQIENQDAVQCIRDYDSWETTFYVDPDYLNTDPGIYEHKVNHKRLCDTIMDSKGFFAVSGYANELYDSYDWDHRFTWEVSVSIQAQAFLDTNNLKNKKDMMNRKLTAQEVLWIKEAS